MDFIQLFQMALKENNLDFLLKNYPVYSSIADAFKMPDTIKQNIEKNLEYENITGYPLAVVLLAVLAVEIFIMHQIEDSIGSIFMLISHIKEEDATLRLQKIRDISKAIKKIKFMSIEENNRKYEKDREPSFDDMNALEKTVNFILEIEEGCANERHENEQEHDEDSMLIITDPKLGHKKNEQSQSKKFIVERKGVLNFLYRQSFLFLVIAIFLAAIVLNN